MTRSTRSWQTVPLLRSIVAAAILVAIGSGCHGGGGRSAVPSAGARHEAANAPAAAVAGVPLYISAGGPDAPGPPHYVADTDFTGGTVSVGTAHAISVVNVTNPAPQSVYQHGRFGNFSYTLPSLTPGGAYTVRLHFAEYGKNGAGKRTFNVSINGAQVLTNFDIFVAAGGLYKATTQSFPATADATAGTITIVFTNVVDHAIVQGIELQGAVATPIPTPTPLPNAADYLTYHSDNLRSGWSQNETILNTTNVGSMTVKNTVSVDGDVLAQPLYISQFPVPGKGTKNLVIVATEGDSVYALDADSTPPGAVVWRRSLGSPQPTSEIGCPDLPQYGITGTPVIARTGDSATIYVVAATEPAPGTIFTDLHALDAGTGNDVVSPIHVAPTWTLSNGMTFKFVNHNQMNRAGLVWANGSLYVAFGSHCDNHQSNTFGWLLRYDSSLTQMGAFVTSEDTTANFLSSIWQGGFAPAVDSFGNLFVVTGNGAYDAQTGGRNFGESVLKLPSTLCASSPCSIVSSFFTPHDFDNLNLRDLDFGSGGVMLLPNTNLAVAMGKASKLFVLNQTSLGGETPTDSGATQVIQDSGNGVWGGPAYFGGVGGPWVYYQTGDDVIKAFKLSGSSLSQTSSGTTVGGYGGSSPIVTSNGMQDGTGLVWVIERSNPLQLEAYDARNLSARLYQASAGSWNNPNKNPFISPLVANGKAYVGGSSTVKIFGL